MDPVGSYDPHFRRGSDWSILFPFRDNPVGWSGQAILMAPTGPFGTPIGGAPSPSLGADGNFYIDPLNDVSYGPKTDGDWGSPVALPPVDLSMFTFTSQLRQYEDSPTAIDLTIDASDSANGNVVVSIPNANSSALEGSYAWDLKTATADDPPLIDYLLAGTATVDPNVTRVGV